MRRQIIKRWPKNQNIYIIPKLLIAWVGRTQLRFSKPSPLPRRIAPSQPPSPFPCRPGTVFSMVLTFCCWQWSDVRSLLVVLLDVSGFSLVWKTNGRTGVSKRRPAPKTGLKHTTFISYLVSNAGESWQQRLLGWKLRNFTQWRLTWSMLVQFALWCCDTNGLPRKNVSIVVVVARGRTMDFDCMTVAFMAGVSSSTTQAKRGARVVMSLH